MLIFKTILSILQVVIVDQSGENAATEDEQLEKLNKEGDEETAKMNEYVLLCFSEWLVFMQKLFGAGIARHVCLACIILAAD